MRKLMLMLALVTLLVLPVKARAQNTVHLESVSVDLWPEYDQPSTLVIYHIALAQGTSLPTTLVLRIPAAAQVNAVASQDPTKGLVNALYQSSVQGDWTSLTITAITLQVQVEYYVSLVKDGTTRHITYQWPGDAPVDALDVNFLLPSAANGLKIDPTPVSSASGQGGLTNYIVRAANLGLNQSFTVTIDYQRQTDELSIASLPVQAVTTPGANALGPISTRTALPWALGGFGALVLIGAVIGFLTWRRRSQSSPEPAGSLPQEDEPDSETIYCPECGKRAQAGDLFCRTCGARLKQSQPE